MIAGSDPWTLPGLASWLRQIETGLDMGLVAIPIDLARPVGMVDSLRAQVGNRLSITPIVARPGETPASVLADAYGTQPALDALLNPALDQELGVVTLIDATPADLQAWSTFLARFLAARAGGRTGPALMLADSPPDLAPAEATFSDWRCALRRGDLAIWAESHLPPSRSGLAAELAVSLGVHLCGTRLDLAGELVRAGLDDLADPLRWLVGRPGQFALDKGDAGCPVAALRAGRSADVERRVWHAQLSTLFPAIEEDRLKLIESHRKRLFIDDHLAKLGVRTVEEIELGALQRQIAHILTRPDGDKLARLVRIRNALAHRKAAEPSDVLSLIKA